MDNGSRTQTGSHENRRADGRLAPRRAATETMRLRRLDLPLADYITETAKQMRCRSKAIRRDFAMHKGAAGDNREELVVRFLADHLPKRFGVRRGFAVSPDDVVSKQADVLVVDHLDNALIHPTASHELWPVEAVYALVEVKTALSPRDLQDAVKKCQRFKQLKRRFIGGRDQRIDKSLFVIWSFDGPRAETIKENLFEAVRDVPFVERPDFVVDLNGLVATSGNYLAISKLGQPNSKHRRELEAKHGGDLSSLLPDPVQALDAGENSLLVWYVWFDSWLRHAGTRRSDPVAYLPPKQHFGRII